MHLVTAKGKQYPLADSWDTAPAEAQMAAAALLIINDQAARLAILAFQDLPSNIIKMLTPEEIVHLTMWVEKPTPSLPSSIIIGSQKLLLPTPNFEEVTLVEFAAADALFRQYQAGNTNALIDLFATLTRPTASPESIQHKDWNGDMRQPYNSARTKQLGAPFAQISLVQSSTIILAYISGVQSLQKSYPSIFPDTSDSNTPPDTQSSSAPYIDLIYALAKQGTYGTYEQCCLIPIHTIFYNMHLEATAPKKTNHGHGDNQ